MNKALIIGFILIASLSIIGCKNSNTSTVKTTEKPITNNKEIKDSNQNAKTVDMSTPVDGITEEDTIYNESATQTINNKYYMSKLGISVTFPDEWVEAPVSNIIAFIQVQLNGKFRLKDTPLQSTPGDVQDTHKSSLAEYLLKDKSDSSNNLGRIVIGVSKNDTLLSKFIKGGYSEKDYLNNMALTDASNKNSASNIYTSNIDKVEDIEGYKCIITGGDCNGKYKYINAVVPIGVNNIYIKVSDYEENASISLEDTLYNIIKTLKIS